MQRLSGILKGFKNLVILICFFASATGTFAQNTASIPVSLIDSLNRSAPDQPAEVLLICDSLIEIARGQDLSEQLGYLLQIKGKALAVLGENPEALAMHMQSYNLFDSLNHQKGVVLSLISLATVHLNTENHLKAGDYLIKALDLSEADDYHVLLTIYANLGVVADFTGNSEKALEYYNKAVPMLEDLKDYNGLAVNYHNIAVIYDERGEYETAIDFNQKAYDYQKLSGQPHTLTMVALNMGNLYMKTGNLDEALKFLEIGGAAAAEIGSPYDLATYHHDMSEWFKRSGDYPAAFGHIDKFIEITRDIYETEQMQTALELEEQFQNDLKSSEIALLKSESELRNSVIERNRIWRLVMLILIIGTIAFTAVLYRNYTLKQKANKLLQLERTRLKAQNEQLENENILVQFDILKNQISPHFLFNSLNALVSLIKTDQEKALKFTNAFSRIFRNTLELKDRHLITLQEEVQHVNAYLYLQNMRFGDNLVVDLRIPGDLMRHYIPPFSLQLVVENAVKHNVITTEQPLEIRISGKGTNLEVTNNLQPRSSNEASTRTGLQNIKSRYTYFTEVKPIFEIRNNTFFVLLPLIAEEI